MNIKLAVRNFDSVFVKSKLNLLLHIIENVPIIFAFAPDKAGEID